MQLVDRIALVLAAVFVLGALAAAWYVWSPQRRCKAIHPMSGQRCERSDPHTMHAVTRRHRRFYWYNEGR